MFEFRMPSLGADMDFGTVVSWHVEVGDVVQKGDIVCDIETQKGSMEVEIWQAGVVRELKAELGVRLPVGEVLIVLDEPGSTTQPLPEVQPASRETQETVQGTPVQAMSEVLSPREVPRPATQPGRAEVIAEAPFSQAAEDHSPPSGSFFGEPSSPRSTAQLSKPASTQNRVLASPAARKLAQERGLDLNALSGSGEYGAILLEDVERAQNQAPEHHQRVSPMAKRVAEAEHVDLHNVQGTGPHEAITRADVERAAEQAKRRGAESRGAEGAGKSGAGRGASDGMREVIAAAMARSKREIPHYYLEAQIDMEPALQWMTRINTDRKPAERLLPAALLIRAVAKAAAQLEGFNGYYKDGAFLPADSVHLGFIISLRGGGVVAPAILEAQDQSVDQTMESLRDVVARARRGKLRAAEMSMGTITVTSLGELGVDKVYGVIYPPQVALVGFGAIRECPWAENGMLGVRRALTMTLAADHRVSDGMAGAKFLSKIQHYLQNPEEL